MKTQEQNIEFQLQAIELLDINLIYPVAPLSNPTTFNFNINIEHKINSENSLIIVIALINIIHEDNVTILGSLKASCIFKIANFNDFFDSETKQVSFPESSITTLNSITISTTRGIMFAQFKGTFLNRAILPVINPQNFVATR